MGLASCISTVNLVTSFSNQRHALVKDETAFGEFRSKAKIAVVASRFLARPTWIRRPWSK